MTDFGSPPPSWYEPPEEPGKNVQCRDCLETVWYEDALPLDDTGDEWLCDFCAESLGELESEE